jgi:hypothetical protein
VWVRLFRALLPAALLATAGVPFAGAVGTVELAPSLAPIFHPSGRPPVDSLGREDVLGCLVSRDFRMWVRDSGWVRGRFVDADARGLWIRDQARADRAHVSWDRVVAIETTYERERTRREGFQLGAAIGYVAGVGVILAATNPPHDFNALLYPLVVAVEAVPFGLVGGWIGATHPGTRKGFERCWP